MKKFRLTICVLLTVISMLLNTVCAFASTPKNSGHLDSIDGNKVSGWAWNSAAPDTPVSVTVTVVNAHTGDSLLAETATADIERDDLKTSGIGNGAHGFEIMIDWSSIPDNTYMIKLSVNGQALPIAYQYDTAIILNQQSMDKFEAKVRPGGTLIYDTNGITHHPTRTDIRIYTINAAEESAKLGNSKLFNTMILGGYLKVCPVVTLENVALGLKKSLPERAWKMLPENEKAIRHGAEIIRQVR